MKNISKSEIIIYVGCVALGAWFCWVSSSVITEDKARAAEAQYAVSKVVEETGQCVAANTVPVIIAYLAAKEETEKARAKEAAPVDMGAQVENVIPSIVYWAPWIAAVLMFVAVFGAQAAVFYTKRWQNLRDHKRWLDKQPTPEKIPFRGEA